ncbi:MAG: hypothetical protein ABW065_04570 [Solirubrobacterales bacterium]
MVEAASKGLIAARLLGVLLSLAVLGSLLAATASAQPEGARIKQFVLDRSTSQAGGHPDIHLEFELGTRIDPFIPDSCFCNVAKDILGEFPAGFIGNPHAVPTCSAALFTQNQCPIDSQVGVSEPYVMLNDEGQLGVSPLPLYNLVPLPGQAGLIAFTAPIVNFPVYTILSARTGSDYGLNGEVKGVPSYLPLRVFNQTIWGVPPAPVHDELRAKSTGIPGQEKLGNPSNSPEKPYLSNPTSCVGPLTVRLTTTAYDRGVHTATYPWSSTSGCDQLNFNPSQSLNPTTEAADSASGLDVDLKVPQSDSPNTPSDSEIKGVTVTLPEGFSINSSAADGKTSCSDVQARFGTEEEAKCPEFSKVGTLSINSWALPGPIPGALYLGEPLPGNRYRVFITADGYATHVKIPGSAYPDPGTGQLTVKFENLPQSPLTEFTMHFFGSERGLMATPNKCGTYPVFSEFEPWANGLANQTSTQFFKITSGPNGQSCPGDKRPFAPGFKAAGASNGAGAHSPFTINITRKDGDQTLSTIGVHTPRGFTATLKGIPYCPDSVLDAIANSSYSGIAELNNPKCPAASQVGTSVAGAGAGSKPLYAPGKVYLTGPYKGAPLSFAVVTPAVSGPYDLGNVVNRAAVNVDPTTAEVTATSDPLPQIIEGIPLRVKSVLINLDRKDFTLNPTNCNPFSVTGILTGDQGGKAEPSSHFQVANCDTLDYEPKLVTKLTGGTKRGGHPALKATLTQDPSGEANSAKAVVALPHSEFLDQSNIRTICTRVQFAADKCPTASIYGHARAITPLLDQPVEGPVYLRSSSNLLPDLVASLKGPASQPIEVDVVGRIDSFNEGIRTTFESLPDTPVEKFVLTMQGGKKGLLVNSTNICKGTHRVQAKLTGQNGADASQNPELQAPCKGKARKKKAAAKKKRAAERAANKTRRAR